MERYIIAPKRGAAVKVPVNWQQKLEQIAGVSLLGTSPNQIQILADAGAIERIREELGDCCHVEPVTQRDPLT
jgi:hypothetical protein